MAERRDISLLRFAIAASLAILPVMLGLVLLVAVVRPASSAGEAPDRYRSVRLIAALKTFEEAVVERPAVAPALPGGEAILAGLPSCRHDWAGSSWRAGDWLPLIAGPAAAAGPAPAERVASSLAAFDAALLRFSTRANSRVAGPVGFDAARWFAAANRTLARPIELPETQNQSFRMGCADLVTALAILLRDNARMLDNLAWRGTEGASTVARWRPDQLVEIQAHQMSRRNPWNGVAGCVYVGHGSSLAPTHYVAGERSAQRRLCGSPVLAGDAGVSPLPGEPGPADAPEDSRWMVPPSLSALLQPLDSLRQPGGTLYRLAADAGGVRRVPLDGTPVEVGGSVQLTIDPGLQALAQKTAACYTGRREVCQSLAMTRAEDHGEPIGHQLLEGAMVRMAAVAVIDVATGRIEALAGAMSPCARQEVDGPGREADCDRRLPYPVQYRPDALLNPAVFHDAMPASTVKPIMAAAFLSDPEVGTRWLAGERSGMSRNAAAEPARESLRGQLMRSDSARFLDRMFCQDKRFDHCDRPWAVQTMASEFGWNEGCAGASGDCGKRDLLFGRSLTARPDAGNEPQPVTALSLPIAYGRLLAEPQTGKAATSMHLMPPTTLRPALVSRCALGADGRRLSDDDWEKCRGGAMVDVVAEGWGQGHARASALGIAGMMATLAAAANGQASVPRPHLVDALTDAGARAGTPLQRALARWSHPSAEPMRLSQDAAEVILSGLSFSHRAGTARSACEQVFDAARCKGIDWLAGKTGTPSFPNDGFSLDEIARQCAGGPAAVARPGQHLPSCSSLRPYKWYVATYRTDASSPRWTKAIAVLTERNWIRRSGQVHGVGDHGPNPSAEIALQIVGRQRGLIPATTTP
ncbi:hypothetical protein [Ideonella sp. YS5]|uniref:hypothetical protein n=1 Tax=Ideonella sp. YS5 TaxID=3453714 RepID=UPI003EE853A8